MNIGLHTQSLPLRGTDRAIRDYAEGLALMGHSPIVLIPEGCHIEQESFDSISKYAPVKQYASPQVLSDFSTHLDSCYFIRYGYPEQVFLECKELVHAVFDATKPNGDRFAAVSEWLADHHKCGSWVPHIVKEPLGTRNKEALGIPEKSYVVGYHGGHDSFDIGFAKEGLLEALEKRKDLWAVLKGVAPFAEHERLLFLPRNENTGDFIHTCDAMFHARYRGETFGLAIAEFAILGKPVVCWDSPEEKAHLHHLSEDKGLIIYKDKLDIINILQSLNKKTPGCNAASWKKRFNTETVMTKFQEVFLR